MTPVVILRPRILAKKCIGKRFKNFLLKNYNATIIMEAFLERVDLNFLYEDLRQILGPHERRFNLKHRYLKTENNLYKMIQRTGVAHWPLVPHILSNMTLIHSIPFAYLLYWNLHSSWCIALKQKRYTFTAIVGFDRRCRPLIHVALDSEMDYQWKQFVLCLIQTAKQIQHYLSWTYVSTMFSFKKKV